MSRDWRLFLGDTIGCCEAILRYTTGMDRTTLLADRKTYDAVLRNIELIGEAVKMIPQPVRNRYPRIEWQAIIGTRNILAHMYFNVDDGIVWGIVKDEIPLLLEVLEEISQSDV